MGEAKRTARFKPNGPRTYGNKTVSSTSGMLVEPTVDLQLEHVISVAIMRAGTLHAVLARGSHQQLRASIGTEPTDVCGFKTSTGRFVTRDEAKALAVRCGQLRGGMSRELLSSDLW
jgi:hypothetical protein